MTCDRRSMSSPRAATSVATSRSAEPSRKRPITRSRCRCSMPPCSASARCPCALSISTSVSTSQPRPAEHERRVGVLDFEHALERGGLVGARDDVGDLTHARQLAGRGLLARDRDPRADRATDARQSRGCVSAASPRRAPSAARPASPRGSPRDPRRSPCPASRPLRRGRARRARSSLSVPRRM